MTSLASDSSPQSVPSTTQFNIRRGTVEDLETITRIWCDGAQSSFGRAVPSFDSVASFFKTHLSTEAEPFGYWLAETEGQIAGWQSLLQCRPNPISRWAHSSTYVSSQNRAKGVGRALLSFATEHAETSGISNIEGYVMVTNEAVIRIIESLGWQRVGIVPGKDKDTPQEALYNYVVRQESGRERAFLARHAVLKSAAHLF